MTDNNRLLKRILPNTVRYVKDSTGKKVGIESYDSKLTITPGNSAPMGSCAWSNIMGKPTSFPTTWEQIADRPPMFDGTWGSLADKPQLFSGSYSDLLNKPNLSPLAASGDYADIKNKPELFSGSYSDLSGLPALFDGKWSSVTGKPAIFPSTWAQVADKPTFFSGSYADLSNKPALFDGTWQSLTGKPVLFDGSWTSLTGKPATYATTWDQVAGKPSFFSGNYGDLINKPSLFSGSYNDLTDKPAIPSMPSLATVASTGSYNDLTNKPTLFNGTWASLSGKPTTLAGFGISDAVTGTALSTSLGNYTTTQALTTLLAAKQDKVVMSYAYPSRALNTAFQISTTRDASVSYGVDIGMTTLLGLTEGTAFLEYADNAAMTTNLVTVISSTSRMGGVLNMVSLQTANLYGMIPAGKYVRIRTASPTGSPTFAVRQGQEVLL